MQEDSVTLQGIRRTAIWPALKLLPEGLGGERAEVILLAIGLQESGFEHRRPAFGPQRGFWRAAPVSGMVGAVLRHPAGAGLAVEVCDARRVPPIDERIHAALEHDDVLAAAFARLLLHIEGERPPPLGDVAEAWSLYCRAWRPAAPQRQAWDRNYAQAMDALAASA